ncbi:MAG TPA: dTDP-4-dehydrorhamnose 3,5-epimerase family protein [Pyrinomonadaceae bacterium]|jgi:dTDP-4-dehydrorhamnose 3,5-epimerase|nr:dTDP-4-dehydrorhamnose 3,5-epimerase family protein [Pyrinomonadaceae bacterium]
MRPRSAQEVAEKFISGAIHDVVARDLRKIQDERGWLAELFRRDDLSEEFHPVMSYISATEPGVTRGPHVHLHQADLFCFTGPSNFKLRMWDDRPDSETYRHVMTLFVGEDEPKVVLVPGGIVHAYRNIGAVSGIIINCPNRLYRGEDRRERPDETRYEDDPDTIFTIDD